MNLPLYIARKYLLSRKNRGSINVITTISIIGIAVCSAAIVIVLSVLNGLTVFIEDMYLSFDADIKVVAAEGRFLDADESIYSLLSEDADVIHITRSIEDQVLFEYENQSFGILKGVEEDFTQVNPVDEKVFGGSFSFKDSLKRDYIIVGNLLASNLGTNQSDFKNPIQISYIPRDIKRSSIALASSIHSGFAFPGGYFYIQKEYDEAYAFGAFDFVQAFFEEPGKLSAYELKISDKDKAAEVKQRIQKLLPGSHEALTWYEQHQTEYRVIKSEKRVIFLILTLMLAITAINITGSLSMIVLEKTRDISVMKSMGGNKNLVRKIFLFEGALIGGIGGMIGIGLGFTFCAIQQYFGIIKLYGGEILGIGAYPLEIHYSDFLLTFVTVLFLSILASLYPAKRATERFIVEGLKK